MTKAALCSGQKRLERERSMKTKPERAHREQHWKVTVPKSPDAETCRAVKRVEDEFLKLSKHAKIKDVYTSNVL